MPRLKVTKQLLDPAELDAAEYKEGQNFRSYEGEIPPTGTNLPGYIKSMWVTTTNDGDAMLLKVLWVADDNAGEYEDLPSWDNISLSAQAKWKWKPFLDTLGLSIYDFGPGPKGKIFVTGEDVDKLGQPVERIGDWHPGSENDEAYFNIITHKKRKLDGTGWQTEPQEWLPYDEASLNGAVRDEDIPDDEPEDEEVDVEDEYDEDEPDEDEEEEAAPPARGRGKARQAAPAAARGKAARPKAATTTTATRGRKPAAAGRGRGRRGDTSDPPF